ncbi:hypothetical protein ASPZODRAFT_141199 [Penicilliopsis zonata CBS 506.65]|uniref:Sec39 domain-containing protein n=1 Tax=Penicilliopsis zonata CBS 506.65 TaxID=1073090 RepID=A0A1L9SKM6_9EURO|nr:hypothetical protein ASPZODRAFT_141199 [Penicilliopsis zonata CBS 506.65]OJJ47614.1 hypothetical protein ASPZODRAFT_141199 [Penicilliopsis zonata CBS 506.65]
MADLRGLSKAHVILLATHICAAGNLASLPLLQARFPTTLPAERLLRIILTFLPESTAPQHYTPVVEQIVYGTQSVDAGVQVDVSPVKGLSEAAARKRVRKLRLRPLRYDDDDDDDDDEEDEGNRDNKDNDDKLLTWFLIHRANRIDSETGLQPLILDLLLPFYQRLSTIRTWLVSSLLPLLRLNYEYYPGREASLSLDVLELMDGHTAINVLLSMTGGDAHKNNTMDLVQNLRGLVGSWIYGSNRTKRRKLNEAAERNSIALVMTDEVGSQRASGWQYVNEWLLARSLVDRESVVSAFTNWQGPEDVDLGGYAEANESLSEGDRVRLRQRYAQSALASIYANPESSQSALAGSVQVLAKIAGLVGLQDSVSLSLDDQGLPLRIKFEAGPISATSRASLLQNALLVSSNPLTWPSAPAVAFLGGVLQSAQILDELGHPIPCRTAAGVCLHGHEDLQLLELKNVISSITQNTRSRRDWTKVRQQLLWLRDWQTLADQDRPAYHGLFWRVPRQTVEAEILKAMLAAKEYQLAADIYTKAHAPINLEQVETAVEDSIFEAYDNASNGNRTRGGMKRAYEILQTFEPHFPESANFKQIRTLIAATHALSFYSLTLQHGVPFQPVSIRVHADPISLIEKVLDQNPKSYTKLDDLLSIGRNLVAGLGTQRADTADQATVTAERRIIALAISAALAAHDFGTAYSYILTRMTPPSSFSPTVGDGVSDDISWRAVYQAGRYRSPPTTGPPPSLDGQITQLSQRMELLSLALVLSPSPDPLPEILGAWRRCDEELAVLRAREADEAELWDRKGDISSSSSSSVPGGFGPTDTEQDAFDTARQRARRARLRAYEGGGEAPMGLFDVARGAARAFRSNISPSTTSAVPATTTATAATADATSTADGERVRKRDMVSNMVTGGLASGIGWVLGAQPVDRSQL